MKVLLVDDDDAARLTLRLALKRRGLDVVAAEGGPQALEALEREAFDWLVTDAHMRGLDGFSLAHRARLLRPGLRIVVVTGVDLRETPHADVLRVLTKPVDDEALAAYLLRPADPQG